MPIVNAHVPDTYQNVGITVSDFLDACTDEEMGEIKIRLANDYDFNDDESNTIAEVAGSIIYDGSAASRDLAELFVEILGSRLAHTPEQVECMRGAAKECGLIV